MHDFVIMAVRIHNCTASMHLHLIGALKNLSSELLLLLLSGVPCRSLAFYPNRFTIACCKNRTNTSEGDS